MNIELLSLLCAVTTALLLLSGCAKQASTSVLPEPRSMVTQTVTEETGPMVPPENQVVQTVVEEFTQLYFAGDREAMKAYLTGDYGHLVDAYPYSGEEIVIQGYSLPQSVTYEIAANGSCWASVAFRETPESDSYTYLSMTLVVENGQWKVESYGLEK